MDLFNAERLLAKCASQLSCALEQDVRERIQVDAGICRIEDEIGASTCRMGPDDMRNCGAQRLQRAVGDIGRLNPIK